MSPDVIIEEAGESVVVEVAEAAQSVVVEVEDSAGGVAVEVLVWAGFADPDDGNGYVPIAVFLDTNQDRVAAESALGQRIDNLSVGAVGDSQMAAFVNDTGSETYAALVPIVDERVDEVTEPPIDLTILFHNANT